MRILNAFLFTNLFIMNLFFTLQGIACTKEQKKIVDKLMKEAKVLKKSKHVYRWGQAKYERKLIGKSPAFDINNINFGRAHYGKGLYNAKDPFASANQYAPNDDPEVVDVEILPGTKVLSFKTKFGIEDKDETDLVAVSDCNPEALIEVEQGSMMGKGAIVYVMKNPKKTKVHAFNGEGLGIEDIEKGLASLRDFKLREKMREKMSSRLEKESFPKADSKDCIGSNDAINYLVNPCTTNKKNSIKRFVENVYTNILANKNCYQCFWNYIGKCSLYEIKKRQARFTTTWTKDIDNDCCKKKYEGEYSWDYDGNCYEILKGNPFVRIKKVEQINCPNNKLFCEKNSSAEFKINSLEKPNAFNYKIIPSFENFNECIKTINDISDKGIFCSGSRDTGSLFAISHIEGNLSLPKSKQEGSIGTALKSSTIEIPEIPKTINFSGIKEPDLCKTLISTARNDLKLLCVPYMDEQKFETKDPGTGNIIDRRKGGIRDINFAIVSYRGFDQLNIDDEATLKFKGHESKKSLDDCTKTLASLSKEDKRFIQMYKNIQNGYDDSRKLWSKLITGPDEFEQIISESKKNHPYLKNLFEGLPGRDTVFKTVEEHTKKVYSIFYQQQKHLNFKRFEKYNYNLSKNFHSMFAAMILMHDIGKSLGENENQHYYTMPIMKNFIEKWNFSEKQAHLIFEITNHDTMGEFLQGKINDDTAKRIFEEKAKKLNMSFEDFMQLQLLFYTSDASSYPEIKKDVFQEDSNGKLVLKKMLRWTLD
ncbi:MAG: hypothetical protein HQK49_11250 [Oligoflexia bacterium]|nr:hypothetical protein [Oligoflexia bacterium]